MEADTSIQDEIDYMILDFLAHQATQAVLEGFKEPAGHSKDPVTKDGAEKHLELFDSYFNICAPRFRSKYHSTAPLSTALRLQLLQFAASFDAYCHPARASTRFSVEALAILRGENRERAALWWEQRDEEDPDWLDQEIKLGDDVLHSLATRGVSQPPQADSNVQNSMRPYELVPTLCDLIPAFVKLTSTRMRMMARSEKSSGRSADTLKVRPEWLFLAAEMMLQASLDDFSGASSYPGVLQDRLYQIFSWGYLQPSFGVSSAPEDAMDVDGHDVADLRKAQLHDSNIYDIGGHSEDDACSNCQSDTEQLVTLNRLFGNGRPSSPKASAGQDDDDDDESLSWESIRKNYMLLIPDVLLVRQKKEQSQNLTEDMVRLEHDHSSEAFHDSLVIYLDSLMSSIAPPLLAQLDSSDVNDDDNKIKLEELDITSEESARLRAIAKRLR